MQVRLLKPINFKKVGTILDVPGGTAETWIMQRKAERVVPDSLDEMMVPPRVVDVTIARRGRKITTA